jgi:hypothetical protein
MTTLMKGGEVLNQHEYRETIRQLPTSSLVNRLEEVRTSIKQGRSASYVALEHETDDWMAREILAELGSRQTTFDI